MTSSTGSRVESAVFQRVIGSLGGEVDFGGNTDDDDVDHDGVGVEDGSSEDTESVPVHELEYAG